MNPVRNKKIILGIVFLGMMVATAQVLAANSGLELDWPPSPLSKIELGEAVGIPALIQYFYEWLIGLGGLAVFVVLVYSGFDYLTSAGDSRKMIDALARIRNAFLGLALLLGSYLILNTINPQLTILKTSELRIPTSTWEGGSFSFLEEEPCNSVTLFSDTDFKGKAFMFAIEGEKISPLDVDPDMGGIQNEVKSVGEFKGDCQLALYGLEDFQVDEDNPPISIMGDVKNIGKTFNVATLFGSAKLINLSGGDPTVCKSPACLFENENFNDGGGKKMLIENSALSLGAFNNQATSLKVTGDYAVVLFSEEKYAGECLRSFDNIKDMRLLSQLRVGDNDAESVTLFSVPLERTIPEGAIVLSQQDMDGKIIKTVNLTEDMDIESMKKTFNLNPVERGDFAEIQIQPGYVALVFPSPFLDYASDCKVLTQNTDLRSEMVTSIQVMKILEKK